MAGRAEVLRSILETKPEDSFARYGLAMELVKQGRHEEAVGEFRTLIGYHPGYAYAYYHGGQALEKLGKAEEARELYRQGIERAADAHARSELQAALDLLA